MSILSAAPSWPATASLHYTPHHDLVVSPVCLPSRPTEITDMDHALRMLSEAERTIQTQEERIRQLENLSITDELTGLMNRRGFTNVLRRELALTRRQKNGAALLILIDLDQFKLINDQYGHIVGDIYLQTAASVLLNEVRTTDHVARIGGDEFAVLLTQTTPKDGAKRLAQLDQFFHKRAMHHQHQSLPLRASFGFAVVTETETPESLMISADAKLYADKARRRLGR